MRKTINFFIVNMCVADLLITLYMPRVVSISYTDPPVCISNASF